MGVRKLNQGSFVMYFYETEHLTSLRYSILYWSLSKYWSILNGGIDHNTFQTPSAILELSNGRFRLSKMATRGLKRGQTLGYWTVRSTFAKYVFWFDYSFFENLKNPKLLPRASKMANRVWKGPIPKLLDAPVNFCSLGFLIQALLPWENGSQKALVSS